MTAGDLVKRFNRHAVHSARALQCWQILIGKAMNRQTVTYRDLGWLMYQRHAAGVLNRVLGHVAYYCNDEGLPPLTSIVVNATGAPGYGIPVKLETIVARREKVYRYDWYDVYPPSERALLDAFRRHQTRRRK